MTLAARPDELITRAELHERLWPGDTFVDFEDGLNAAMSKLRDALGDDIQAPRYIETVRGRGYRFIARVEATSASEVIPSPAPAIMKTTAEPAARAGPQPLLPKSAVAARRLGLPIVASLVAGLALAGAIAWLSGWRVAHAPRISIAVLPFANMTGDPAREYICNGITEELIAQLSHLAPERLRVIAPTSAKTYANTAKPLSQIARELKVQYLIEGSLQQQGADVRVAAQLVRAQDQSQLWANVYEGDLSQQFEFETAVGQSVAHALAIAVPAIPRADYRPGKYQAYDAYLKGRYFFSQRSKSGFEQAIDEFSTAVALEPRYAAAYAQLAAAYDLMGQYNWMNAQNARNQARAAANQALSLDPAQAEAHAAIGFALWYYDWNDSAAEEQFREAVAKEPDNVDAHHWYEQMLMTAGRFQEAEAQMRAALEADPRSPILHTNLGWLYYFEGRNQQAVDELQAVLKENPDFLTAHYKLWHAYSVMGDKERAWQQFRWVIHAIDDAPHREMVEAAYRGGGYAAALRVAMSGDEAEYYGSLVDGARCLIFAGDREGALHFLEQAYRQHEGWTIYAPADPAFAPLRNQPRFQQIVAQIRVQGH